MGACIVTAVPARALDSGAEYDKVIEEYRSSDRGPKITLEGENPQSVPGERKVQPP